VRCDARTTSPSRRQPHDSSTIPEDVSKRVIHRLDGNNKQGNAILIDLRRAPDRI